MKIYALSSGSYSDYSVLAVCKDKPTVEKWREALANYSEGYYRDAFIEELHVIEPGSEPTKVSTYRQNVELWDDGRIETRGVFSQHQFPIGYSGPPPARPQVRYVRAPCHSGKGGRLEVTANSEQWVAKVVGEKVAMWKAGAFGGPGVGELNEEIP